MRENGKHNGVLIHPVDTPLGKVYTETPSRVPNFKVDVLAVTTLFTFLSFTGFCSMYIDFWPGWATALVGIVVLYWRVVRVLGDPIAIIKETFFQPVKVEMKPERRSVLMNANGRFHSDVEIRNAKVVTGPKGNYEFSGRQLDQLQKFIDSGNDTVRRDASGDLQGLADIGVSNRDYPMVIAALEHQGFIGQDKRWTERGKRWLRTP